ncbi:unnamed protein product, partial [Ectocarpus sp. 6 AP-2014]
GSVLSFFTWSSLSPACAVSLGQRRSGSGACSKFAHSSRAEACETLLFSGGPQNHPPPRTPAPNQENTRINSRNAKNTLDKNWQNFGAHDVQGGDAHIDRLP